MSPWQSVEHLLWWLIVALLLIVQSVVGSRLVVVLSVPLLCTALWAFVNHQELSCADCY